MDNRIMRLMRSSLIVQIFFLATSVHSYAATRDPFKSLPNEVQGTAKDILVKAFPKEKVTAITAMHGGMSARVFLVKLGKRSVVLRLVGPHVSKENFAREIAVTERMAAVNLGPRVLYSSHEQGALVISYIKTQDLELFVRDKPRFLDHVADKLKLMHGEKTASISSPAIDMFQKIYSTMDRIKEPIPASIQELISTLRQFEGDYKRTLQLSIVHHDINPNNILYDGKRLWFIDFELTGLGDKFYDLATVLTFFTQSAEEEELFLKSYFGGVVSPENWAKVQLNRLVCLTFYGTILQVIAKKSLLKGFAEFEPMLTNVGSAFKNGFRWADFKSSDSTSLFGMLMLKEAITFSRSQVFRNALFIQRAPPLRGAP